MLLLVFYEVLAFLMTDYPQPTQVRAAREDGFANRRVGFPVNLKPKASFGWPVMQVLSLSTSTGNSSVVEVNSMTREPLFPFIAAWHIPPWLA
jgi:hypothetical protein